MKAFLMAMIAIAVISTGAAFGLESLGYSSAKTYSSDNVRL